MPIKPTRYIWFNGELVPWENATVHVMTHALHYGSSVFEGIRCYSTPRGPAVFRLALGRTIPSLQASWVKMGLDAATEALRWGVNDLGGTLMEESISRMAGADHGVKLEPHQLVAAAHAAGRPAAERTTLYSIRRHYDLVAAA